MSKPRVKINSSIVPPRRRTTTKLRTKVNVAASGIFINFLDITINLARLVTPPNTGFCFVVWPVMLVRLPSQYCPLQGFLHKHLKALKAWLKTHEPPFKQPVSWQSCYNEKRNQGQLKKQIVRSVTNKINSILNLKWKARGTISTICHKKVT